ncbi:hypothetical protein ACFV9E_38990, partial [Streptomyces sp. NPDC059835]|uniref:hypothetical protein n=1 Tax=Streptomyces sp. NPDC059835 TaxID=3346967 RepID=UPI00365238AB
MADARVGMPKRAAGRIFGGLEQAGELEWARPGRLALGGGVHVGLAGAVMRPGPLSELPGRLVRATLHA